MCIPIVSVVRAGERTGRQGTNVYVCLCEEKENNMKSLVYENEIYVKFYE